jgi:hypothetical protein
VRVHDGRDYTAARGPGHVLRQYSA